MSQESSPITQWREKVERELWDTTSVGGGIDDYGALSQEEQTKYVEDALTVITSATIELIEGLIGEDEEAFRDYGPLADNATHKLIKHRNALRAELRQSLKELNNGQ